MPEADPRYIPQAKSKKKTTKKKRVAPAPSFPTPPKRPETKPLKKKSPRGEHHVWAN